MNYIDTDRRGTEKIESHLSTASLIQINEEKYAMIRNGISVTVKKQDGTTDEKKAMVIDLGNPNDQKRNHFLRSRR